MAYIEKREVVHTDSEWFEYICIQNEFDNLMNDSVFIRPRVFCQQLYNIENSGGKAIIPLLVLASSEFLSRIMIKFVSIAYIFGVCAVLADVAPYPPSGWKPQRALLVLPQQTTTSPPNATTPQPLQDEAENLEKVNESVMERLRQEIGSDTGVYYVYLPDGRLQRVQYTTAPIKQQDEAQNTNNYQQSSQQYRQDAQGARPQGNQQSNHQVVFGTNKNSNQANQQQQYNRYQTQQQFGESTRQGYAQTSQSQQNTDNGNSDNTGNPSNLLAQYSAQQQAQNLPAANYIASVQFTDVPPITGPIFAYNPTPLVRVVRYANNF